MRSIEGKSNHHEIYNVTGPRQAERPLPSISSSHVFLYIWYPRDKHKPLGGRPTVHTPDLTQCSAHKIPLSPDRALLRHCSPKQTLRGQEGNREREVWWLARRRQAAGKQPQSSVPGSMPEAETPFFQIPPSQRGPRKTRKGDTLYQSQHGPHHL